MSIDRLTAEDQIMLRGDEIWPQDIGALVILDGRNLLDPTRRFRIEVARGASITAASRAPVPAARIQTAPRSRRTGVGG